MFPIEPLEIAALRLRQRVRMAKKALLTRRRDISAPEPPDTEAQPDRASSRTRLSVSAAKDRNASETSTS